MKSSSAPRGWQIESIGDAIKDVQRLNNASHCIQRNPSAEQRHGDEQHCIQHSRLLVEAQPQIFGNRSHGNARRRFRAIEHGHENQSREEHRRNRTQCEIADAGRSVSCSRCAHAEHFQRSHACAHHRQPAKPTRQLAPSHEIIPAACGSRSKRESRGQHKESVDQQDQPVSGGKNRHAMLLSSRCYRTESARKSKGTPRLSSTTPSLADAFDRRPGESTRGQVESFQAAAARRQSRRPSMARPTRPA